MATITLYGSVSDICGSYPSPLYPTLDSLKAAWLGPYVEYVWRGEDLVSVRVVS